MMVNGKWEWLNFPVWQLLIINISFCVQQSRGKQTENWSSWVVSMCLCLCLCLLQEGEQITGNWLRERANPVIFDYLSSLDKSNQLWIGCSGCFNVSPRKKKDNVYLSGCLAVCQFVCLAMRLLCDRTNTNCSALSAWSMCDCMCGGFTAHCTSVVISPRCTHCVTHRQQTHSFVWKRQIRHQTVRS